MDTIRIDRDRARRAFAAYVEPYDAANPRIALKVAHTYRVADLCEAVAQREDWSPAEVDLAWLCGLLHDIGRFEQLRRWDTFSDAASASHAALGVHELFETADDAPGNIRRFIADRGCDALIRTAVSEHSAFRLPDGLDERTRRFCDVLRDADKVDILRVMSESDVTTILGVSEEAFCASGFSDTALRAFSEHRCLARNERSEPADYLVGLVSFVFELRFAASRQILAEQGCIFQVLERPFGLERPFARHDAQATWQRIGNEVTRFVKGSN